MGVFGLAFLAERLNLQTLGEGCLAFRAWSPEVGSSKQTGGAAQFRVFRGVSCGSGQHQDPLLGPLPEVSALPHEEFTFGEALLHAGGRTGVDHVPPQSGQQVAHFVAGSPLGTCVS